MLRKFLPGIDRWRRGLELVEPNLIGPPVQFPAKEHLPPRNRIQARVDAIVAAGGRILGDRYAPAWVSLLHPEGSVVDIATRQGRGGALKNSRP